MMKPLKSFKCLSDYAKEVIRHGHTQTHINRNVTAIDMYNVLFVVFFRYFLAMMCLRSSLNLSFVFYVIQMSRGKAKECNSIARVIYRLGDGYWLFQLWKLTPKQPINQSHRNDLRIDSVFVDSYSLIHSVRLVHCILHFHPMTNAWRKPKPQTRSHSFPQKRTQTQSFERDENDKMTWKGIKREIKWKLMDFVAEKQIQNHRTHAAYTNSDGRERETSI